MVMNVDDTEKYGKHGGILIRASVETWEDFDSCPRGLRTSSVGSWAYFPMQKRAKM
jgi:hypothetical protein